MHQLGLDIVSCCEFLIFILNDHCMKSNIGFMGPITMILVSNIQAALYIT